MMADGPGKNFMATMVDKYDYKGIKLSGVVVKESLDELQTFDVRPDDVWICTYPKSGTHFAMEIASLILGDGDPFKVNRLALRSTVAMILMDKPLPGPSADGQPPQGPPQGLPEGMAMFKPTPFLEIVKTAPSPRLIITHLPFQLLPPEIEKRAKVIYVARNPKDVLTSMYNFTHKTIPMPGGFQQMLQEFVTGELSFGPWTDHVMGFWNKRDEKNVLFMKYEDMVQDLEGAVEKVFRVLEHPLSDELKAKVVAGSEFSGMKKTYDEIEKTVENGIMITRAGGQMAFMQKGKIGTWKTRFTVAENERFDQWYEENFAGKGVTFQFE